MENKRLLPPRTRPRPEPPLRLPQDDDLAMLLLLSSAGAPLPPVQSLPLRVHLHPHGPQPHVAMPVPPSLLLPPPTGVLAVSSVVAPGATVAPRQRRILPRPSPLELTASPVRITETEATEAADVDSPPPRLPVSRSTSGMSAHSTASSGLSVADLVAELAVAPLADRAAIPDPASRTRGSKSPAVERRGASPDSGTTTTAASSVDHIVTNDDDDESRQSSPSPSPSLNPSKPVRKKRIRIKTARRREQCRANQARYRNKQRDYGVVLAERVEELRAEVQLLAQQSETHHQRRSGVRESPIAVATEYFRLFRYGLTPSEPQRPTASPTTVRTVPPRHEQLTFLHSAMAPTLQLGWDVSGVDALVEQWRRYSQFHDDSVLELTTVFEVDNVALDTSVSKTIHATASLTVTLTAKTIAGVFPHLLASSRLTDQLVGARVAYPWTVVFEFDERGIVQRLTSSADFVMPLMAVLRSAEDVAMVLEGARVQHAWQLGPSGVA